MCDFLGVEAEKPYLDACTQVVFPAPHLTRERIDWTDAERDEIERIIARYPFFDGYSWSSVC
jgi:hypothetical protein